MNITHTIYNSVYKRYESYSETDDLNIYYNFYSPDKTKIMIITAFKNRNNIYDTSIYTDEFGNVHDINEDIEQAEADIQAMKQTASVTFRWSEFEIRRAKAIAKKIGIPYQTYIKMSLKQAMDNDEKKYN